MKIIVEPDDGIGPVIDMIRKARKFIYANFYLIDNDQILSALKEKKRKKVDVRIIYDGRPYGEANVSQESDAIKNYGLWPQDSSTRPEYLTTRNIWSAKRPQ